MMNDAMKDKGDEKEGDKKKGEETMKAGDIRNWIRQKVGRRRGECVG